MAYPWESAIQAGQQEGKRLFYDDPDMQMMRQRRMDLSQGYDGKELGAMRESARREIAGQSKGYMNQLGSNLARQGVGGARAAAVKGAAGQKFAETGAEAERRMLLDSAKMKREGTSDLQQFLMNQRYGQLSTGLGYGQLASAYNTADAMRASAGAERKSPLEELATGGPLRGGYLNAITAPFNALGQYLGIRF